MYNGDNYRQEYNKLESRGIIGFDMFTSEETAFLLNKKNTISPHNHRLAGHIKSERKINPKKVPQSFINKILTIPFNNRTILDMVEAANYLTHQAYFSIGDIWINRQKKYEYNPIHNHDGLFSFILFLKIPFDLKKEDEVFSESNCTQNGRTFFINTLATGQVFPTSINVDKSYENKLFMFNSKAMHGVYPFFTSNGERITVSGNVYFDIDKHMPRTGEMSEKQYFKFKQEA